MIKEVILHGSKYFSASIISAAISFLMTKYYTQVFSPSDFGIMTLYVMVFEYISVIGTLSTEQAVSRKIFDYEKEERVSYISSVFWFYLTTTAFLLLLGLCLSTVVSDWIMEGSYYTYIVVLVAGGLSVFYKLFNLVLVNEKKSNEVLKASVSNSIMSSSLSVVVISIFQFGILGRFIGQIIGAVFYITILFRNCARLGFVKIERKFDYSAIRETVKLSIPVILSTVMVLLFSYADRIFLKTFSGDVSVGMYGLALIIGKLVSMVFDALSKAFFPVAINALNESYLVGAKKLEYISYKYYLFLISISILLYLVSPFVVIAISSNEYLDAQLVMPFVFLGIVVGGSYKIPSTILMYHKVIWFYPFIALVSFLVNASLNYFLIPVYGLIGAGISTFFGYVVYSFSLQCFSFKYFSYRYMFITSMFYALVISMVIYIFFVSI